MRPVCLPIREFRFNSNDGYVVLVLVFSSEAKNRIELPFFLWLEDKLSLGVPRVREAAL